MTTAKQMQEILQAMQNNANANGRSVITVDDIAAAIRAIPIERGEPPCPYIVTGDEGTSYCRLAEKEVSHD